MLNVKPFRFPEPPQEWVPGFMEDYTGVIIRYLNTVSAPSAEDVGRTAFTATTALAVAVALNGGLYLVDTTAGNVAVTLPAPSLVPGREFIVKRTTAGANTLTIAGSTGDIDGAATAVISAQYGSLVFKSDGANYWLI